MNKKVLIGHSGNLHAGPGQVLKNLIKGLDELGYDYMTVPDGNSGNIERFNEEDGREMVVSMIQPFFDWPTGLQIDFLGPNIFVLPREFANGNYKTQAIVSLAKNFIVPSIWVKDKYNILDKDIIGDRPIHVWSVGIDTEEWKPQKEKNLNKINKELTCLIYYKNRTKEDLQIVCKELSILGIKYNIIEYGKYAQNQLKDLCEASDFGILIDNTESQGIATMEMMSMGLPLLVMDQTTWVYEQNNNVKWMATSAPYFDESLCGFISGINENLNASIINFLDALRDNHFNPRKYMIENHTLKISASKYIEIINL